MPKSSQGGSTPLSPPSPMAWPSLVACQEQPLLFDWKSCFLSRRGASPRDTLSSPFWSSVVTTVPAWVLDGRVRSP